jgi:hypothetical protein
MKLRGTKTEEDYRKALIKQHNSLFHNVDRQRMLLALRKNFPNMKTAYIIDWIPEQGEDIINFLVDTSVIAQIEFDRIVLDAEPQIEVCSIEDYSQGLRKWGQIKFAVALDLAQRDLER